VSLSRPFIERPVATALLMVALLLAGVVAYRQLPMSALPQVDYPTIQVVTFYPGAGPDVTAATITAPLERQLGQMPGLNQMTSTSSDGSSIITLQFDLALNIDVAEQQVQAAINGASTFLPADLPYPPIYNKVNPADAPILTLALTSDTVPLTAVRDLTDTRLAQKIAQLPGVGLVLVSGGEKPAIRVQVNPVALATRGLTLEGVRQTIAAATVNQAKGSFDGPQQAYTIGANDQLLAAADYRPLVIAYANGAPVQLADVADVVQAPEDIRQAAWVGETPAVIVNIQRQPGANLIGVVDRIKQRLPELAAALPSSVHVSILSDRSTSVRASVRDVQFELMIAIALVVTVIFLFLRTLAATVIPGVTVPLAIVGTFAGMYLLGFSLDNLSLMALTIATGFLVDDAVVMIENIARHVEAGKPPLQAALDGAGEIGFTIVSLTASLIAVLIPLLFMGDLVGRLFREFAITLAITILISAIVSLTLTPMMCARLLGRKSEAAHGWLYRASERAFQRLIDGYGRSLDRILRHQPATLVVAAITLALTIALYVVVPKGLFPVQDTGAILAIAEAPQSISFAAMAERQQAAARVVLQDPAVASLASFIGADGTNITPNSGRMVINLAPTGERKDSIATVIARLEKKFAGIEGIRLYLQPVQDLTVSDRVSRGQYQYTLEDPDAAELGVWADRLAAKLGKLPELRNVATDRQDAGLAVALAYDRATAARLGVTPQMIDAALYDAFGQRQISTTFTQLNQYRVVLEVKPEFRDGPESLQQLYVGGSGGKQVPLDTFTSIETTTAPLVVNRQGQFPAVTISLDLPPGASLGDAVRAVERARAEVGLPPSIQAGFQGAAATFIASLANEPLLILAAIVTVYIVLGVLYESFIHPV
jgi:multidrug efflux pump